MIEGAAPEQVYDVLLRLPKTVGRSVSVAEARAALRSDHTHMVLITDEDGRLLGTLIGDDLAGGVADAASPALELAVLRGRTISPGTPAHAALREMVELGERRRAVVDVEGRLLGLLCLKRRRNGFCSDADVRSRYPDRSSGRP